MRSPASYACFLAVLTEDGDPERRAHEHLDGSEGVAQRVVVDALHGRGSGRSGGYWVDGCCAHGSMVALARHGRHRSGEPTSSPSTYPSGGIAPPTREDFVP